jgi:uncharacterized SAM-binding protein YcdF (DUF218 family)
VEKKILNAAKTLWDYLSLGQSLKKSDCIIAMGSHDLRVAEYAADLVVKGWAPILICSGGLGRLTRDIWRGSEAERFRRVAIAAGVIEENILVEDRSTNTGENILFSKELLEKKGYLIKSTILVHKPYMERRALATAKLYWPDLEVIVSSPKIPFKKYATSEIPLEEIIQIMVGDFHRILIYPEKGFQIKQEVTKEGLQAFNYLKAEGYTRYLVNE